MAVLEDIRKKGGIIVSIVIGLALLAFVVGDFLPGGRKGRMARNLDIAEVGGRKLVAYDYENKITEVTNMYKQNTGQSNPDEQTMDMIRDQAWQVLLNETIMEEEYAQIGLIVSPEELFDLIQGPNPSPRIRQYFSDPQTGEFNRSALINFLKNKNADINAAQEWNMLEKSLLEERYVQKYSSLISNGVYIPTYIVENENLEVNKKVDFDYMLQSYFSLPDSTVKITNSELKRYYEKHKYLWEQADSRDIEYVVFNIVPSDEDRAAADEWIAKIKPEFEQAEEAFQFVRLNAKAPADNRFMAQEQLPIQIATLFDAALGTVVGPYQEEESLKLAKLVKVENRPDSVKVRQIIILPKQQTQQAATEAVVLADSIKNAIERGANFAALAAKYSADPSVSTTNGDIGWIQESQMQVGTMAEQLFSMKKGEVSTMESAQGVFVVQVTERGKEIKKVQVAILQHDILPSSRTEQILYSQASKFAIENRTEAQFDQAATDQGINKRVASYLGENDRQIPGLTSARQVVRWAYEAKRGTVSDVFTLNNAYVVAVLKNIRKKGIAPFEQVETELEFLTHKEKKAEQMATSMAEAVKTASSFAGLAESLHLVVESASGISFSTYTIPGVGVEPELIAATTSISEGNISQPVKGTNGVFVFTVKQITEPEEGTMALSKERLSRTYASRFLSESVQALHKAANIKDMRSKFY